MDFVLVHLNMTRLLSFIFLLTISISSSLASYLEVQFEHSTIEETRSAIASSGKYALVYFTADWCMPCQVLQESHFRDERIINQINNGFVSIEADYSEMDHIEWYDKYEVRMLPTLLIIDDHGNEVDRIQNIRNTRQLYLFLHNHSKISIAQSKESRPMAYKLDKHLENDKPLAREPKVVRVANTSESKDKTDVSKLVRTKNIYAVDVDAYKNNLSIQFAAYTRYGNALKYLQQLKKEGLSVSILEEYVKGKKYFKVVQRAPKEIISSLYDKYKDEGKECFIRPATIKS